jgi:hypothetical protein
MIAVSPQITQIFQESATLEKISYFPGKLTFPDARNLSALVAVSPQITQKRRETLPS